MKIGTPLRVPGPAGHLADRTSFRTGLSQLQAFSPNPVVSVNLFSIQATGFLIVTSPERAPVDEAIFFADQLERSGMHRCAVILNRFHEASPAEADAAAEAARLVPSLGPRLAEKVARRHADVHLLARRDRLALKKLADALNQHKPVSLADREADVHDVSGLVNLHGELFGAVSENA